MALSTRNVFQKGFAKDSIDIKYLKCKHGL